jgi:hypothetical protein
MIFYRITESFEFDLSIFFYYYCGCRGQFARTSTNLTDPESNDHVSLKSPLY